jgi:antitoxin component of MazEF toxin-antitoxin module
MLKNLVSHGNSMALIIDKPLLDVLRIKGNEPLEVSTDGQNLIISPIKSAARHKKFLTALKESHAEYGEVFRKLAKEK